MTEMYAEWRAMSQAQSLIAQIHDDLIADQTRLERSVSGLMGTWTGSAADSYRAGWMEWTSDADDVLASLHTMSELIGAVSGTFQVTDTNVAGSSRLLDSRLGGEA